MGLFQFTTKPRSVIPRELLNLHARIGGTIGQIKSGMDQADVVKVRDNVYVAAKKPARALVAMVNLARADVHTVDHPADIQLLVDRLRALEGS